MKFFVSRFIIAFLATVVVTGALVAIMPSSMPLGLLSAVAILPTVAAFVWFGASLSRRFANHSRRLFWPYLLANVISAGFIVGLGLAGALGLSDVSESLSTIFMLIALLAAAVYLPVAVLAFRGAFREQRDSGVFWLLLRPVTFPGSRLSTQRVAAHISNVTVTNEGKTPAVHTPTDDELFRTVTIEGESTTAQGSPIPTQVTPKEPRGRFPWSRTQVSDEERSYGTIRIYSKRNSFVADAQRYRDKVSPETPHVPFQTYHSTYSDMSADQRNWYFYWRSEVRQGNFIPADLSYLFVYIYELLNVIGVDSPKTAFNQLNRFWKAYRNSEPKLDNYLVSWLGDFIVVHRLPLDVMNWYWQCALIGAYKFGYDDVVLEGWAQFDRDFRRLPAEIIYNIAGYNPSRNKFYRDQSDPGDIDRLIQESVQAIEEFLQHQSGQQGLVDTVMSESTRPITRTPFVSANHGYDVQRIEVAQVHPWTACEPFAEDLRKIVRATENALRQQRSYRSLQNATVPREWHEVILGVITPEAPKVDINIDIDAVAILNKESQELRQRLTVDEEPGLAANTFAHRPTPGYKDNEVKTSNTSVTDEASQTESELDAVVIDLDAAASLQMESEALRRRLDVDKTSDSASDILLGSIEGSHALNDGSPTSHGDDHGRSISSRSTSPSTQETNTPANRDGDTPPTSPLSDDWSLLAETLKSYELEILMALQSQNGKRDTVEQISRSVNLTASRVIDDINESALDTIGDNIIDVSQPDLQFIEEYEYDIQELLSWSKSHRNTEEF